MTSQITRYLNDAYRYYKEYEWMYKSVSPKEYGQHLAKKRRGRGKRGSSPKRR